MTSAPDTADDADTLPPPGTTEDTKRADGKDAAPVHDKPSVAKCEGDVTEESEDRPTWRPFPGLPRSPTGFSGTFEAVPSSKGRFPRRRAG